jgi:hypothetical protein
MLARPHTISPAALVAILEAAADVASGQKDAIAAQLFSRALGITQQGV